MRRRTAGLLIPASLGVAALAAERAPIPWTELTFSDWLFAVAVKSAVIDGRTIYYPTPTKELAAALERKAAAGGDASAVALRHLAEARFELGDRSGAEKALAAWAAQRGDFAGWDEAARWGVAHRSYAVAFDAAAKALATKPLPSGPAASALATDRIAWVDLSGGSAADELALRAERAALFPRDAAFVEDHVRALVDAGRPGEAEEAIAKSPAFSTEKRLALRVAMKAARGEGREACDLLEELVSTQPVSQETRKLFAETMDASGRERPAAWRASLEKAFERKPLLLLATYFTGKDRGDLALELYTQIEKRYEEKLDRQGWLLLSRLWDQIDAVPQAFRARLAASVNGRGTGEEGQGADDLAALTSLALRAGSRSLPWGVYNDEPYRWAARVDTTPGFSTGGLSLLLTGFEREKALSDLEQRSLGERTFGTARLLLDELSRRAPRHPRLPALTVAFMSRHVERGDGAAALALLPQTEAGGELVRGEARRIALLAARQLKPPMPVEKELRLLQERLALLAPEGSNPSPYPSGNASRTVPESPAPDSDEAILRGGQKDWYGDALREGLSRLSSRDRANRASLTLLLGELDRHPGSESLWTFAADKISSFNLDDGVEERYRAALTQFDDAGWWNRLARWYARRKKQAELAALLDDVVARFRGSEIFRRDPQLSNVTVPAEGQPNPFILYGAYLRLAALRRFPSSPTVLAEAEKQLVSASDFEKLPSARKEKQKTQGVVPDDLLVARRYAVLFADADRRGVLLGQMLHDRSLEPFLVALEKSPEKTPVELRLLVDGWSRLSRFERAVGFADPLAESYPGDGRLAGDVLSLHRSLSQLDPAQARAAASVADRTVPALVDPKALLTAVGETWQDLDQPEPAGAAWRKIVETSPRDPVATLDVATVLWDYGRGREALDVLTEARRRLGRPHLHAFEAGVLREELHDLPGALDEYVAALKPPSDGDSGGDTRARNRLGRLLARKVVRDRVLGRISALKPGVAADEETLGALLGLVSVSADQEDQDDDWMDPPSVREERARSRERTRPAEREAIVPVGSALLRKSLEMIPKASSERLLSRIRGAGSGLADRRFGAGLDGDLAVTLEAAVLAREAALAPNEPARVEKEIARAEYLLAKGRRDEARAAASGLKPRLLSLPEGGVRIKGFVALARLAESGDDAPDAAWKDVSDRYPWSLGVLEDRLAFLQRTKRVAEALDLLERTAAGAAAGHRERLTERLVAESLSASDLARARRAVTALLGLPLDDDRRLSSAGLLARVSLQESASFDALALARAEAARLPKDRQPDLWARVAAAAQLEGRTALATDLYLESLNRRMDTAVLDQAARAAVMADGQIEKLRSFFEAQRKRSPRDVRWAVAVRDLDTVAGDLDGAIVAAKEAVLVAPDRFSLHREVVTLFERAGRRRDGADFLAGWATSHAADESVATLRAELYVAAGDVDKALAVERDAIAAFTREAAATLTPDEVKTEARARTARAARRFRMLGRHETAWTLAVPAGNLARAAEIPLSHRERAAMALSTGNFLKLYRAFEGDEEFRSEAAAEVSRGARIDQLDEIQDALVSRLFKADGTVNDGSLDRLLTFADAAGLTRFREAITRRLLQTPRLANGPWGKTPPAAFVAAVDPIVSVQADDGTTRSRISTSGFLDVFSSYASVRELDASLEPVLASSLRDLEAAMGKPEPDEPPSARWFPVASFARLARTPAHEDWRRKVQAWFATADAHARFLAATAKRWDLRPLVDLLDEGTRDAWLAHTNGVPALVARVDASLAALVEGRPGAVASPDVERLRGPRTIGDVLGNDARFLWPAFDGTRMPAALWGARATEAWTVLEALARFREKRPDAPWVPLELPNRRNAGERTLMAVRTAEGLGDGAFALALDERFVADLGQLDRLRRRLRLLAAAHRGAEVEALSTRELRARQDRLTEEQLDAWESLARDLSLGPVTRRLDPGKPLSPNVLATLYDRLGPKEASAFKPKDVVAFRGALAARWSEREDLDAERLRVFLDELWARDAAAFPESAARKQGPPLALAVPYLTGLDAAYRVDGLAAVRALPDAGPLRALASRMNDARDETQLLLLAAEAGSPESASEGRALARLDALLSSPNPSRSVRVGPLAAEEPLVQALATLCAQASPTRRAALTRRLVDAVTRQIRQGRAPAVVWAVALRLSPSDARPFLLKELERTWARGEWPATQDRELLTESLVGVDAALAARWLDRLEEPRYFDAVASRAALLSKLDRVDDARRVWEGSRRLPGSRDDEARAFDAWRQLARKDAPASTTAPASWVRAQPLRARKDGGDALAAHLLKHPYDRLAAGAILDSLAPASEDVVILAHRALTPGGDVPSWRFVRKERPRSARVARALLGEAYPSREAFHDYPDAEVDGLLADLARLGAETDDTGLVDRALGMLRDRSGVPPDLPKELATLARKAVTKPPTVRLAAGKWTALRPADLTWDLYAKVLTAEDVP